MVALVVFQMRGADVIERNPLRSNSLADYEGGIA